MSSCETTITTETVTVTKTRVKCLINCILDFINEYEKKHNKIPDINTVIDHVGDAVWFSYSSGYRCKIKELLRTLQYNTEKSNKVVKQFGTRGNFRIEYESIFGSSGVQFFTYLTYKHARVSVPAYAAGECFYGDRINPGYNYPPEYWRWHLNDPISLSTAIAAAQKYAAHMIDDMNKNLALIEPVEIESVAA